MNSKLVSLITPLGLAAGLTAGISAPAFAQQVPEHGVFILNSVLFLMSGFLVMFMACGFCMLEAGLVRAKKYHHPANQECGAIFDCRNRLLSGRLQSDVSAR